MDNLSGYEKVIFENNCEAMILNQYQREYYENYDNRFRVTEITKSILKIILKN